MGNQSVVLVRLRQSQELQKREIKDAVHAVNRVRIVTRTTPEAAERLFSSSYILSEPLQCQQVTLEDDGSTLESSYATALFFVEV